MPRITPIDPATAQGKAKDLLSGVQKKLGLTPNMMRAMAQSPAVLQSYLSFSEALGSGSLSAKLREQVAVAIASASGCQYCASAHTAIGKNLGVDQGELKRNLAGESNDAKAQAAIDFARAVVEKRGWISDADFSAVKKAGFSQGEIAELVAVVAINTFTNYFNHIAQPEVDFPKVEVRQPVGV